MTDQELLEIESRANAATPGRWTAGEIGVVTTDAKISERYDQVASVLPICDRKGHCYQDGTTRFIANARADIPALVAEVRRLKLLVHQQELAVLGAVVSVAEIEKLKSENAALKQRIEESARVFHWYNVNGEFVLGDYKICTQKGRFAVHIYSEDEGYGEAECDFSASVDAFDYCESKMRKDGFLRHIDTIIRPEGT